MKGTLRAFIAARSKDGEYRKQLDRAFYALLKRPCAVHRKQFGVRLGVAVFGDRLVNAVLSDRVVVRTGAYRVRDNGALYHFAPTDRVEKILSRGLLPTRRYVFLTDQPQRIAGTYLPWKTAQLGHETTYTLLRIDAEKLSGIQKIFRTDREHEYVTGKIDAKYITVAPDNLRGQGFGKFNP